MSLKFCANLTFMFQETASLLERYELAKKAGFKAVECAFPYEFPVEKVLEAKKEAGVQQILINAYPGDWENGYRGLAAVPGKERDFEESLEKSIEYAKHLDCERMHIMSGLGGKDNFSHYIQNLNVAAKILEKHNIVGLIEPICPSALPNYFLNSYEEAISAIETVNSNHLQLQLDFFHLQQISGNLTKNIQRLLRYVGHIQIAQVPDRNEPNTPGEIDYRYILSYLNRLAYDKWIGLEYNPKSGTVEGLKWIKEFGYSL